MFIKVRVTAGAKKESVEKTTKDTFIISIKEKAKNNRANRRLHEILASSFRVPVQSVRLKNGHKRLSKLFEINN